MLSLLQQLPPEARGALETAAHSVRLERAAVVHRPGDQAEAVFLVASGRVRLHRVGEGSREVSLAVCGPGDVFGELALAAEPGLAYGSHAEALEPTALLAVGGSVLLGLLRRHPTLGVALSAQLARQARGVEARLADLVFLEVRERLALALLRLASEASEPHRNGLRLKGKISHQDLAHLVGSTRETVTKILGELKTDGLLELGYRRVVLTDLGALRAIAGVKAPAEG